MASDLARVRIILHGIGILRAFRQTLARTDYASGLKWEKVYRLQKLGGEDQQQLSGGRRLRLARLDFEELAIRNQHEFARRCWLR